ncbi:response regulator [Alteromonas sp. ASW11-130]|uniref:response regulator n=1 Tax=Alteromonas sp. ASW11-130 TaxID=3015775 RepID=UPI00224201CC|nr:response regulator [Alteromonas sp. ASW11-130]MCW8091722.1 response regulator [Alteromonas sp. ASW11-130]
MSELNIVAIDDDDITLEIIKSILEESLDAFVFTFSRSKQAREFLVKQSPETLQLIISDQNMPEYNGLTLLKMCNAVELNVPFILLTADASRETVVKAKQLGIDGYIAKPINKNNLIAKVKDVLQLPK